MLTPKQEVIDLTVARAIFAGWVFLYHVDLYINASAWLGPAKELIRRGYLGVDGFFILSGLVLARAHPELATSPRGALQFWVRRLARIYPVHLATILLFAGVLLTSGMLGQAPHDAARFSVTALWQNLLLVQGWGISPADAGGLGAWNYPSWSISTEWAGYLLFPLLWFLVSHYEVIVSTQVMIAAILTLGMVGGLHHQSLNLVYGGGLPRFLPEFFIGLASARILPYFIARLPPRTFAWVGAALVLLGTVTRFDVAAVLGLWFVLFAFALAAEDGWPPMLGSAWAPRFLGLISYSFYMSFALAELLLTNLFRHIGWIPAGQGLAFFAAMLTLTSTLALALYFIVEQPCRRAALRLLDGRPALSLEQKPL